MDQLVYSNRFGQQNIVYHVYNTFHYQQFVLKQFPFHFTIASLGTYSIYGKTFVQTNMFQNAPISV